MSDDAIRKEELIEELRLEVAKLLLTDDVSDDEKLRRFLLAKEIIERAK
jgi:hypothetical protein